MAGFVFSDCGSSISTFRWVPGVTHVIARDGGSILSYTIPIRSWPFITNVRIADPIAVLLLISGPAETEKQYDLGDYKPTTTFDAKGGAHTMFFHRITNQSFTVNEIFRTPSIDLVPIENVPDEPVVVYDDVLSSLPQVVASSIEDQYHQLLVQWGVDVVVHGVTFVMPNGNPDVVETFQPLAMLFDVSGNAVHTWCGTSNRFGRNVLLTVDTAYPSRGRLTQMRLLARSLRFPILLGYGVDANVVHDNPPDDDTQTGILNLLFRPGDGLSQTVHFAWDECLMRMALVSGVDKQQ